MALPSSFAQNRVHKATWGAKITDPINWEVVAEVAGKEKLEALARESKPASADAREVMLRAGRVPYHIHWVPDLAEPYMAEAEVKKGQELPPKSTKYRMRVKKVEDGNVWSSYAYLKGEYHLPVLDVDKRDPEDDQLLLGAFNTVAGREVPHEWVPSSTEGHYHLYIDWPFHWDDYKAILMFLRPHEVIEEGYIDSALKRGATFVRFPWVPKPDFYTTDLGPFPHQVHKGYGVDDDPFPIPKASKYHTNSQLLMTNNDLHIFMEEWVGIKMMDYQKDIILNVTAV